jgi:hypothetical protein
LKSHRLIGETFFDLPREIRGKICTCLQSDKPTQVSGERLYLDSSPDNNPPVIHSLATGLVSAGKQIPHEAVAVFYSSNICGFLGSDSWDLLSSFLLAFGTADRSYLSRLETGICQPDKVTIYLDRMRTTQPFTFTYYRSYISAPNPRRSPLCLTIHMEAEYIPGITVMYNDIEATWGLELPDHVERIGLKFAKGGVGVGL